MSGQDEHAERLANALSGDTIGEALDAGRPEPTLRARMEAAGMDVFPVTPIGGEPPMWRIIVPDVGWLLFSMPTDADRGEAWDQAEHFARALMAVAR